MVKLVGYRNFVSKKNGKEYCVASVVSDLTERDRANGAVGNKVEEIFLPEDLTNYLKPDMVNKEVTLDYELSNGRAYLVNLSVKDK